MTPRQALIAIAVALAVIGIVFGLQTASTGDDVSCGSVFSPSNTEADAADFEEEIGGTLSGATPDSDTTNNQSACDSALSDKKPIAYGGVGLGIVALIAAFVAPSRDRRPTA